MRPTFSRWNQFWAFTTACCLVACGGDSGGGPTQAGWTVMVYMAADNNLAVEGIGDIDEMEAAGVSAGVNVVVQAEFNPTTLAQYGCNASCFNRPNFNTFRYKIAGGTAVTGPNGAAQDIGNRDMTSPAQLAEFVQWARQNYPAQRYMLVLWNHGGGYTGLLEDETSSPTHFMSLEDLRAALSTTGVGPIDVIDFDMCLMGGYETLVKISGLASYAVFSEEVVPGAGNPYQQVLAPLHANPNMAPADVARMISDAFHASYGGDRSSTTISAYDVAGFAQLDAALGTLAAALQTNIGTVAGSVSTAAAASQKYSMSELTDLVSFLDSLRPKVSAPLQANIDAVRVQAIAVAFRLRNLARNGTGAGAQGAQDVSRSTGLNIVLPSGVGEDQFQSSGPRSLAAYSALYPGRPWTQFLSQYAAGLTTGSTHNQGSNRLEVYLVWQQGAVAAGADVDLWVLEPNGDLFIPYLGSITPNGTLTSDSYDDGIYFEGYLTRQVIEAGEYKFYADLWIDPGNYRPLFDVAYRFDQDSAFVSLYDPNYPQLSRQTSWLNDPTPTFAEADSGYYTDLQFAAIATFAPNATQGMTMLATAPPYVSHSAAPTTAQLHAAREYLRRRDRPAPSPTFGAGRRPPIGLRAPGAK